MKVIKALGNEIATAIHGELIYPANSLSAIVYVAESKLANKGCSAERDKQRVADNVDEAMKQHS